MAVHATDSIPLLEKARSARQAASRLSSLETETKNRLLGAVAQALEDAAAEIIAANETDLERARTEGVAAPLVKRLAFDRKKLDQVVRGLADIAALPDPVGRLLSARELDKGLELYRKSYPLGVIGMVFESRPDALVQMAGLCLKSGNAVLLKGGREALETNRVLARVIGEATRGGGLDAGWIHLLETRQDVTDMLALSDYIDLVVPRGSQEFVRHIMANTIIPVLGHADGVCHAYLDSTADVRQATEVITDAKTQYVAVCNAIETLLVHADAARNALPAVSAALGEKGVKLRGCPRTREILPDVEEASESDWSAEYLDYVLAVRIVDSLEEAIEHINRYGSHHTDVILSSDKQAASAFMDRVDSASVMWNCSTRFADGFRYGLGAEVGISTSKLHARGPVGLEGLVTYKWLLYGSGQAVADYSGENARPFSHKPIRVDDA
ncbi:MAG: glutamate-5-semialdehyde dehydrogenase [Spirochaetaceae bacterium]